MSISYQFQNAILHLDGKREVCNKTVIGNQFERHSISNLSRTDGGKREELLARYAIRKKIVNYFIKILPLFSDLSF